MPDVDSSEKKIDRADSRGCGLRRQVRVGVERARGNLERTLIGSSDL
jgi:hypothetical protein